MKALSVRQPWASLIVYGEKIIELRRWSTQYRGPLLICASKTRCIWDLPMGVALGIVDLVDIRPSRPEDAQHAGFEPEHGEMSWMLANARIIEPFPVLGRLSLFEVELPKMENLVTIG